MLLFSQEKRHEAFSEAQRIGVPFGVVQKGSKIAQMEDGVVRQQNHHVYKVYSHSENLRMVLRVYFCFTGCFQVNEYAVIVSMLRVGRYEYMSLSLPVGSTYLLTPIRCVGEPS